MFFEKCKIIVFIISVLILLPASLFPQNIVSLVNKGDLQAVKSQIEKDPELINYKDRVGYGLLHWAAISAKTDIAGYLVSKGADINERAWKNFYPLLLAVMWGRKPEIIDFFIDNGADYKLKGSEGVYLLHQACNAGHKRLVQLLLESELSVNSRDKYGFTALHNAVLSGKIELVEFLLNEGADKNIMSNDGRSPLFMAKDADRLEIFDLLRSKGAKNEERQFPVLRGEYLGMKKPYLTPLIFAPGIVSSEHRDHGRLVFSPDGQELHLQIQYREPNGGFRTKNFIMSCEDGKWTPYRKFDLINEFSGGDPVFSPDGNRLYFRSKLPLKKNDKPKEDFDIWYFEKDSGKWGEPVRLNTSINTEFNETSPFITGNGTMYFLSNRNNGNSDIYRAEFKDGKFNKPERLPEPVNSENFEGTLTVAEDESYIIFNYRYPSETYKPGLMISFNRFDGTWTKPFDLKDILNLKITDLLVANISPDGKFLFILDDMDIYWVSTKVIEILRKEIDQ